MRPRPFFALSPLTVLRTGLLTVLLLVSCAPANNPAPAQPEALPQPTATATVEPAAPAPTEEEPPSSVAEAAPTEAPTEVPQPVATSRGPNLEATDPATVSLASGELQLVEFFRFT